MRYDSLADIPGLAAAIERHRDDLTYLETPLPPGYNCVAYSHPDGGVRVQARQLAQVGIYVVGTGTTDESRHVTYAIPQDLRLG